MDQTELPILLCDRCRGPAGCDPAPRLGAGPAAVRPVWSARGGAVPAGWLCWDILADAPPRLDLAPRAMLHLAGVTGDGPELDRNLRLAEAALRAADGYGCRSVFLASSAAVYGAAAPGRKLDERAPLSPVSAYGRSKVAMERLARDRRRSGVTCLRIGKCRGADALLGEARPGKSVVLDTAAGLPNGPERSWIGHSAWRACLPP